MTTAVPEEVIPGVEGFSIDPSTWMEPKESFPGLVLASEYRWCADKYLDGVVTRIAGQAHLTQEAVLASLKVVNPTGVARIPQWDLRVKRLDAILQLPDGSQADAVRYGGFDLVKWSNRDNVFVPINPNYGKEAFISGEWKRIAGQTEPPTVLTGKFFEFDYFPSKRFGGSMPAKRVLVPTKILPPTFQYAGEVRIIVVTERAEATGEPATDDGTTTPTGSAVTLLTEEEAVNKLITEVLPGKNSNQAVSLLATIAPELRVPTVLNGLATGELIKRLAAEGRITVAADGTIS